MFCKNLFSVISLALFVFIGNTAFAACPSADLTDDCFVDMEDLVLIANQWLNGYSFEDFAVMAIQWLTGYPNMVYIPDGEFEMGDHHGDEDPCLSDELPVHAVLVDSFFMSKFEITNQQYCDYLNSALGSSSIYLSSNEVYGTGNNQFYCDTSASSSYSQIVYSGGLFSVRTKPEVGGRDMSDDPMVRVSWYGAVAYCNWRSSEEDYESCYDSNDPNWPCDFSKNGYRLATEAEWEYAARGGEHNPYYRFPWGDTISHRQANYYSYWEGDSPVYPYDVSPTSRYHPDWDEGGFPYTSVVGSFASNGYGLYDMIGNVWEWCNDWYDENYYDVSPYDNPQGPASSPYGSRVLRVGGWGGLAINCRVASRNAHDPGHCRFHYGFRIVLDLE